MKAFYLMLMVAVLTLGQGAAHAQITGSLIQPGGTEGLAEGPARDDADAQTPAADADAQADDTPAEGEDSEAVMRPLDLMKVSPAPTVNPYPTIGLMILLVGLVLAASFKPAKRTHQD